MKKIKLFEEFNSVEPIQEAFYRLPKDVIENDLYFVSKNLTNLYDYTAAGNDIDPNIIEGMIKKLEKIKKSAKKFNSGEEVAGTVYEGAVKQFDADFNDMVKNIKSGYGWIDPDYAQETWENTSDIDFESVKVEIYKRLIKANLLWLSANDGESKGKQVKSLKEIGVKESVEVNEAVINISNNNVKGNKSKVDASLIDKLVNQIAPVLNSNSIVKLNEKSYREIIEAIAKSISGTGALQTTGLVFEGTLNEAFDVKVSFRHAKDAIGLFNDMFIKYGKRPSSDVFSFKQKDAAIDFVQMLVKNLNIPMGEIEADDMVIKNLK